MIASNPALDLRSHIRETRLRKRRCIWWNSEYIGHMICVPVFLRAAARYHAAHSRNSRLQVAICPLSAGEEINAYLAGGVAKVLEREYQCSKDTQRSRCHICIACVALKAVVHGKEEGGRDARILGKETPLQHLLYQHDVESAQKVSLISPTSYIVKSNGRILSLLVLALR